MRLVQLVLTDDQALQLHAAAAFAAEHPEDSGADEAAVRDLQQLSMFFAAVADSPERFPVRAQSAKLKKLARHLRPKGPAQPQSRRNKRKARQEQRTSFHKKRRKERQTIAEEFNRAVALIEAERREIEALRAEGVGVVAAPSNIVLPAKVEKQQERDAA